jgi:hypothetical protein
MDPRSGGSEYRRYPRMNVEYDLWFHPVHGDRSEVCFTKTKVLGLGGLMFESDQPIQVGSFFRLKLSIKEKTIEVTGRVVYANTPFEGPCQIGVEFVDIAEHDREFLLAHYMREQYQIDPE